jgi:hypothetical protein
MVMYAQGQPDDVLKAFPVLDKPATRVFAERLFPGAEIEEIGDVLLSDAEDPPEGVAYIGCFPGLDIVCNWSLIPDRPSQLDPDVLKASEYPHVYLLAFHAEADWCAYGVWDEGELTKGASERGPEALELGRAMRQEFFGIVTEGEAGIDDADPEMIPVVGYRITRTVPATASA